VNLRRAQAVKDLQARYRGLKVSYTLPAATVDHPFDVATLVRPLAVARKAGAVIDRINLLPVDVNSPLGTVDSLVKSARSIDAARGVIDTATGLHEQIMRMLGLDAGSAWRALGIIPVLGRADLTGNSPLPGGVTRLLSFAKANGLGLVGFLPLVSTGTCGSGGLPVLSVPLLDCLDLNVLPHFFEISDTVRRALH
jgi:chitinase